MTTTKQPSESFNDWISDVWNLHQSAGASEVEECLMEKLKCAASQSASPLFLACAFGFVWLLERMRAFQ